MAVRGAQRVTGAGAVRILPDEAHRGGELGAVLQREAQGCRADDAARFVAETKVDARAISIEVDPVSLM